MSQIKFHSASLHYGISSYAVEYDAQLHPFPETFDVDNAVEQAKLCMAIMSNASGGHTLKNCKVSVSRAVGRVTIIANGATVTYRNSDLPEKLTLEQAMEWARDMETTVLGTVVTDQYGDGWKRARWIEL